MDLFSTVERLSRWILGLPPSNPPPERQKLGPRTQRQPEDVMNGAPRSGFSKGLFVDLGGTGCVDIMFKMTMRPESEPRIVWSETKRNRT